MPKLMIENFFIHACRVIRPTHGNIRFAANYLGIYVFGGSSPDFALGSFCCSVILPNHIKLNPDNCFHFLPRQTPRLANQIICNPDTGQSLPRVTYYNDENDNKE
jgi:hypothetical protein